MLRTNPMGWNQIKRGIVVAVIGFGVSLPGLAQAETAWVSANVVSILYEFGGTRDVTLKVSTNITTACANSNFLRFRDETLVGDATIWDAAHSAVLAAYLSGNPIMIKYSLCVGADRPDVQRIRIGDGT